jgi:hypothetical protein
LISAVGMASGRLQRPANLAGWIKAAVWRGKTFARPRRRHNDLAGWGFHEGVLSFHPGEREILYQAGKAPVFTAMS